jgi:hypothetical protein
LTLLTIALVLWVGAGVLGFFVGRSGSSPGCLIFLLIFIVTGGIGLLFFILGSVLGRNTRRDEMRAERRGRAPGPQGGTTFHPTVSPPGYPVGVGLPHGGAGVASGAAPGWFPDPGNPTVTRYWDGARWTHQLRWDGSTWVPF